MRMLLILALTLAAACGGKDETVAPAADEAPAPQHGSIDPPTPEDVGLRIRAEGESARANLRVGQTFAVELRGVPTAGYLWAAVETPAFLEAAGEYSGPTSTAQFEPGFAGGSHWEVFVFKAVAAGEGALRFEQRQPWAPAEEAPAAAFVVTVEAAP